jgi:hypothetical protein
MMVLQQLAYSSGYTGYVDTPTLGVCEAGIIEPEWNVSRHEQKLDLRILGSWDPGTFLEIIKVRTIWTNLHTLD